MEVSSERRASWTWSSSCRGSSRRILHTTRVAASATGCGVRVARETQEETGVSAMDIDIVYGWNEAQRRKDMQLHYQGLDRAQRVGHARVTMCI